MQRQQTKADPSGMTTRKAKASQKRKQILRRRRRMTTNCVRMVGAGSRERWRFFGSGRPRQVLRYQPPANGLFLDRKPAVTRAPKQRAQSRPRTLSSAKECTAMVCPACKTETGSDSQFCPHCGANTTTGVAAAVGGQQGGLSETASGVVAYITIIPAIIFLVMEPYNRSSFIRFHAWQSIFFGITVAIVHFVLGVIPILGWILLLPVGLAFLILWIFVMIKASKGERYKIPFIGNFAEQAAK